ncbi:hypothetical protein AL755_21040 [Arthrobacter sp. ERGS1:01]|uniref:DUF899 family protein n=1 Tax=Arthrobacter sp. ERGS1:01 TaxID=1704044 RepID=UPI0006B695A2|nr:DUF899 family protein [Arthrobacter sp. ERGS1:01]ALE07388.1 hypothetical protein AL755_21040 [Arthrobacter sp. ERGS1:01]
MAIPQVVSADEWRQAREKLLIAEKEATRAQDALAARRRRLPMVAFDNYTFTSTTGEVTLLELFGENDLLALYQFMDVGPEALCPGCTHFTNNVTALDVLADNGTSWATVSNMPIEQIDRVKAEKGWTLPFHSSRDTSFAKDCGADGGFLLNVFFRDGDQIYRSYSTTQRGVDRLLFVNNILDLTAYGRQEDWEDSPEGWPQHPTYG